ncbi:MULTISPECIES: hypothetical protein [unclassified Microcoleus]|uniref:hypothetical protein n=1 Tax=unclassified Microcoleus TaxID=2642155 RepID=UPI002FD3D2A4
MSKPNPEIKFVILKASYWVGDATEYGIVYWLIPIKGRWCEDFESAEFFDTRSDAEQRLTEEKCHPANQNISLVEVELYRD